MKSIIICACVLFVPCISAGQPIGDKKVELSLSGSFQNFSSEGSSSSSSVFLISPRVGIFVVGGLQIEPEFALLAGSGGQTTYLINGNVAYNFLEAGRSVPFVLVGYGIANTVPVLHIPFVSTDFMVGVLNVGGGVKGFISDNVALRIEYRFQQFTGRNEETSYGWYSYERKIDTRIQSVQFGLSVLL